MVKLFIMEEISKSKCQKEVIDENGNKVLKDKRKFNTLDEAIEACKILNARLDRIDKVVSYKCSVCHKYHIGRNGKEISDKVRNKLSKTHEVVNRTPVNNIENWNNAQFKIVGKIDLSKVPKK